jgi:hypothetical protein
MRDSGDTGAQKQTGGRRRPKLVRSGRLSVAHTYVDLFRYIMGAETVELGILHISNDSVQGDIVIENCTCLLGASTNNGLRGWEAMRALLTPTAPKNAIFQYHDFTGSDIGGLNQGLNIKLARVVAMMPELPADVEDLSSRNSLIKMRAMNVDRLTSDEVAQQAVTAYLVQEVQKFEERSMRFRAAILWSFFAIMVLAAIEIHGLHL